MLATMVLLNCQAYAQDEGQQGSSSDDVVMENEYEWGFVVVDDPETLRNIELRKTPPVNPERNGSDLTLDPCYYNNTGLTVVVRSRPRADAFWEAGLLDWSFYPAYSTFKATASGPVAQILGAQRNASTGEVDWSKVTDDMLMSYMKQEVGPYAGALERIRVWQDEGSPGDSTDDILRARLEGLAGPGRTRKITNKATGEEEVVPPPDPGVAERPSTPCTLDEASSMSGAQNKGKVTVSGGGGSVTVEGEISHSGFLTHHAPVSFSHSHVFQWVVIKICKRRFRNPETGEVSNWQLFSGRPDSP